MGEGVASATGGDRLRLHAVAYATFFAQLMGYLTFSTYLQWRYYHSRGLTPASWKVQSNVPAHKPDGLGKQVGTDGAAA